MIKQSRVIRSSFFASCAIAGIEPRKELLSDVFLHQICKECRGILFTNQTVLDEGPRAHLKGTASWDRNHTITRTTN
jgi:hypothetical protein